VDRFTVERAPVFHPTTRPRKNQRATCKGARQSNISVATPDLIRGLDCFVADAPRNDGEVQTVRIFLVIARFMRAIQPLRLQAILGPKYWITRIGALCLAPTGW